MNNLHIEYVTTPSRSSMCLYLHNHFLLSIIDTMCFHCCSKPSMNLPAPSQGQLSPNVLKEITALRSRNPVQAEYKAKVRYGFHLCRTPCKQPGGYEHSFVTSLPCFRAAFIHSCNVYVLLAAIFVTSWRRYPI